MSWRDKDYDEMDSDERVQWAAEYRERADDAVIGGVQREAVYRERAAAYEDAVRAELERRRVEMERRAADPEYREMREAEERAEEMAERRAEEAERRAERRWRRRKTIFAWVAVIAVVVYLYGACQAAGGTGH